MNESSFGSRPRSQLATIAATTLLAFVVAGCSKGTHVTTKAAGHEIHAVVSGTHAVDSTADSAVISSEFGAITIERSRLKLGNNKWTKIPEDAEVEVRISKGKLWASAGNVTTSTSWTGPDNRTVSTTVR